MLFVPVIVSQGRKTASAHIGDCVALLGAMIKYGSSTTELRYVLPERNHALLWMVSRSFTVQVPK